MLRFLLLKPTLNNSRLMILMFLVVFALALPAVLVSFNKEYNSNLKAFVEGLL